MAMRFWDDCDEEQECDRFDGGMFDCKLCDVW